MRTRYEPQQMSVFHVFSRNTPISSWTRIYAFSRWLCFRVLVSLKFIMVRMNRLRWFISFMKGTPLIRDREVYVQVTSITALYLYCFYLGWYDPQLQSRKKSRKLINLTIIVRNIPINYCQKDLQTDFRISIIMKLEKYLLWKE